MSDQNQLKEQYEKLKELLISIELDLSKNISGNKSAGIRLRKTLREVKKEAAALIKNSVAFDKE
tara:strand:+ start:1137 stop:1328 length:192 start_codon:yes stop_codon:yes gene_type:complete